MTRLPLSADDLRRLGPLLEQLEHRRDDLRVARHFVDGEVRQRFDRLTQQHRELQDVRGQLQHGTFDAWERSIADLAVATIELRDAIAASAGERSAGLDRHVYANVVSRDAPGLVVPGDVDTWFDRSCAGCGAAIGARRSRPLEVPHALTQPFDLARCRAAPQHVPESPAKYDPERSPHWTLVATSDAIARLANAWGLSRTLGPSTGRQAGAGMTLLVVTSLAGSILYRLFVGG